MELILIGKVIIFIKLYPLPRYNNIFCMFGSYTKPTCEAQTYVGTVNKCSKLLMESYLLISSYKNCAQ